MSSRVLAPIVIGITGKRTLEGREETVRSAISRLFERLDANYSASPKILLSALAEGADTIAAEEAVKREGWQVIAPLPLSLDLYLEDFGAAAAARQKALLDNPMVMQKVLRPLRDGAADGNELEPESLRRRLGVSNPQRTDHYEQAGLFIADRATILIAVKPEGEKPDRVGGTARIVHYRLNGPFDDISRDILARSRELRAPELLDNARSGPVWLVDPAAPNAGKDFPATVQLPTDRTLGWPRTPRRLVDASLVVVDRLDRFNRRTLAIPDKQWQRSVVARAGADTGDSTAMLKYLRLSMSAIQGDANRWRKRSVFALAMLFALAAAAVELREGFWLLRSFWWTSYFLFGVVAVVIYWTAARGFWQQISEDYRAVAEALRVQIAWWESSLQGPEHRVERMFLCGTSGALALVRAAVRHCVDAALLTRKSPPVSDGSGEKWINDQIKFFDTRISARRKYLLAVDTSTWILFLGALGSTAFIALIPFVPGVLEGYFVRLEALWSRIPEGTLFSGTLVILAIVSLGAIWLQTNGIIQWIEHHHPAVRLLSMLVVVVMGMTFAASLFDLAAFLVSHHIFENVSTDPVIKALTEQFCEPSVKAKRAAPSEYIQLGQAFAELFAVVPAAIAGAIRYVAEKLSWEAELHGYEDALRTFRRAKEELAAAKSLGVDAEASASRRKALLIALGKEALEESEGWIRAHRERLIEPVV